jgi:hypothetical protein
MEAVRDAQAALTASYEQLQEAYERQRQLEEIRRRREQAAALAPIGVRLGAAVRDVRERLARPAVWAPLKEVSGSNYTYYTLRANTDSNLTQWPDQPPGQAVTYRSLARLNMYPVILSPSWRMGFGRVGRGQISYVRSAVDMQAPESFAGMRYRLNVECPGEDFETANLHITLTPDTAQLTAVKLLVQFDGRDAVLTDWKTVGDGAFSTYVPGMGPHTLSADDVAATFASPAPFRQLMHSALASFKYNELGIYGQNAEGFFPPEWLLVTLLEYAGRPILVGHQPT